MAGKPRGGSKAIRKPATSPLSLSQRMRSPVNAKRRSQRGATSSTPSRSNSIGWSQRCGAFSRTESEASPIEKSSRCSELEVFMATDLPGILIVDDHEDNRYKLQLTIESDGHERITCAAGGNEAIALIKKEKFSLVLLDLMMPDLNGDEVLKVIKSDPDKRDIPVVMISADTDADKVSQCIELGADDYLPKPFNPTILRARIGAALRRHSLRALESEYLGKLENEKR